MIGRHDFGQQIMNRQTPFTCRAQVPLYDFQQLEQRALLSATLVKDINRSGLYGPVQLANLSGVLIFNVDDGVHGYELWKSDGTSEGTMMIKDINPGSADSYPRSILSVAGTHYFTAYQPATGTELWRTDGTAEGTVLVKDIYPGTTSGFDTSYTVPAAQLGGNLYFPANDGTGGTELWKSDGTTAGTVLVKDIRAGLDASSPNSLFASGSTLYFSAYVSGTGSELWKSDGTSGGTVMVKDIYPGVSSAFPAEFVMLNGTLLFRAYGNSSGAELWRSDGTSAGTTLVKDFLAGSESGYPIYLTVYNNQVYFSAWSQPTLKTLWKTDGTPAGTVPVTSVVKSPSSLSVANGLLLLIGNDGVNGDELWRTDGTSGGTALVMDINPGSAGNAVSQMKSVGTKAYFFADDGAHGREIWTSDGTFNGTFLVADITSGSKGSGGKTLTVSGSGIFFVAEDGINGFELWKTSLTTNQTAIVKLIDQSNRAGHPRFVGTTANGNSFFLAYDDGNLITPALYRTDGTSAGTTLVKSFTEQFDWSGVVIGNYVFFHNYGAVWRSDGTSEGTIRLRSALHDYSYPEALQVYNEKVYFAANSPEFGHSVFETDGTAEGTKMSTGFPSRSFQHELSVFNGSLYSLVRTENETELWRSDGTSDGTVLLSSVSSYWQSGLFHTSSLTYYFIETLSALELWRSDGTVAGTSRLLIPSFSPQTFPHVFASVGNTLYLALGSDIWRTDGSVAGSAFVKNVPGVVTYTYPQANPTSVAAAGKLLFTVDDPATGNTMLWQSDGTGDGTFSLPGVPYASLYAGTEQFVFFSTEVNGAQRWCRSDGTPAGTVSLDSLVSGSGGIRPSYGSDHSFTFANGALYLIAATDSGVLKLWRTDGTAAGTIYISDVAPSAASFQINSFFYTNSTFFLAADNGLIGVELYRVGSTRNWSGSGGTSEWTDAGNWEGAQIPGPDSEVTIGSSASQTVTISSGNHVVQSVNTTPGLNITNASLQVLAPSTIDGALGVGTGGQLDLTTAALVLNNTSAGIARGLLHSGYAPSLWGGSGITSSAAANTGGFSIYLGRAADRFASFPAVYRGLTIQSSSVLLAYALAGDANLDERVNSADFNLLAGNFGQAERLFSEGDFNYDGAVDSADFAILASTYGRSTALPTSGLPAAAPAGTLFASSPESSGEDESELSGLPGL
jgi:ELWxxDGT repeat protein